MAAQQTLVAAVDLGMDLLGSYGGIKALQGKREQIKAAVGEITTPKKFSDLNEEVIFAHVLNLLKIEDQQKILCLLNHWRGKCLNGNIQDLQNYITADVIWDTIKLYFLVQDNEMTLKDLKKGEVNGALDVKCESSKKFLEKLAGIINDGSEKNFIAAENYLAALRLTGQNLFMNIQGMAQKKLREIFDNLTKSDTLENLPNKIKEALKQQFPADQPGAIGDLAQALTDRHNRREQKKKNKK